MNPRKFFKGFWGFGKKSRVFHSRVLGGFGKKSRVLGRSGKNSRVLGGFGKIQGFLIQGFKKVKFHTGVYVANRILDKFLTLSCG